MKFITSILALYFLVILPTIHLCFPGNKFIYDYGIIIYFALILIIALSFKRVSSQELGFNKNNIRQTLTVGIIFGILPILSVYLLDGLLVKMGLEQSDLLSGANLRTPDEMGFHTTPAANLFSVLFVPFVDQVFIMGLIINNVFIKDYPERVIIGGGIIYSLIHFQLNIGCLFLGMISAGLLKTTGSIIPSILVHTGFAIAELSIVYNYPRLISLLVFFV